MGKQTYSCYILPSFYDQLAPQRLPYAFDGKIINVVNHELTKKITTFGFHAARTWVCNVTSGRTEHAQAVWIDVSFVGYAFCYMLFELRPTSVCPRTREILTKEVKHVYSKD